MTPSDNKHRTYAKPSTKVILLDSRQRLLSGSPLPIDEDDTTDKQW